MKEQVLVTGAAGNLGNAVVEKFVQEGWKVTGTVMTGEEMRAEYDKNLFSKKEIDLQNSNAVAEFIDELTKKGAVQTAVLTVGGFAMGKIEKTSIDDIVKQFNLNFTTAWNVVQPLFQHMLKNKSGRIFLIGSKPGLSSKQGKGMTAYSLAKSLMFQLAGIMNAEAEGTDVVTSVIVPSTIDTAANRKSMPDADPKKWVKPESIANVIYAYSSAEMKDVREPVIKVYHDA